MTTLCNRLLAHLQANDRLLVIEVKPDTQISGSMPNETWDWLVKNRNQ